MPACRSTGMGPGGVKFDSTSSTGKIGTTGRSFGTDILPATTSAASFTFSILGFW
jgi:hypothetical protein